jgi:stress-induced morphogen
MIHTSMRITKPCKGSPVERHTSGNQNFITCPPRDVYKSDHRSVFITSPAFQGKMQLARHRMINSLMKEELAKEGGIHALQLITRTPEEEETRKQKEAAQA